MWICPDCNQLVPNPVNRKCPNGHGLFDGRILGLTTQQPFATAITRTLLVCLGITVAVVGFNQLVPGRPLGNAIGYPMVAFFAAGIVALLRARKWQKQGGPVTRLIPRAVGMGLACILAGGGLLALGLALGVLN